jgi:sugar porter (SP) family MFS transporter
MSDQRATGGGGSAHLYVALVAGVAAVGGLLFGYDTGVISGAILYIRGEFAMSASTEGVVVGVVTLGALAGALGAGVLADAVGRRMTNITAGLLFLVSSLVSAFAPSVDTLVAGRFLVGCGIGLTSVAAPMYIAEVAPAALRGRLVSGFQLAVTIGILAAYLVCEGFASSQGWRWMLGLAVVPGALLAAGMLPLPESPRWLAKRGREGEAASVLRRVRDDANVDAELAAIREDLAREGRGSWADLLSAEARAPLTVGVGLAVFQQVTGINAVIYYAPQIFQSAGFQSDAVALGATIGVGVINVLATFIAIGLVDRAGRKPLLLAGVAGMIGSLAVLAMAFRDTQPGTGAHGLGTITMLCLGLYIVFFAFSLGPIVWLMISEIFPYRIRAQAIAVSTAANWAANFVVSLTFPVLRDGLGSSATFFLYAVMGVATLIFVVVKVPETKGRTLEEIGRFWR